MIKVGIITASDKGSQGERKDLSGKVIMEEVKKIGGQVIEYRVVPDDKKTLKDTFIHYIDFMDIELVFTTGGTGLGPRDVTPDATLEVIDKEVPGIAETMRYESMKKTNRAMLSRAVAGVRKQSMIINLPGSPKAVKECLEVILHALPHGIDILRGRTGECARQ